MEATVSKYTTSRNGVVTGWDNVFSYRDEVGVLRNFNAILWPQSWSWEPIHGHNYMIQTPAQQVLSQWGRVHKPVTNLENYAPDFRKCRIPSEHVIGWLKRNEIPLCVAPVHYDFHRENLTFFFEKLKHARMLRDHVEETLKGGPNLKRYLM